LAERKNVIFLGAPGTGKTDLSIASAVQAARRGRRVASASAHQWVTEPAAAKRQGGPDEEFERIGRLPVIVVDEVGYVPCDPEAAALFFTLVSSRCHLLIWREDARRSARFRCQGAPAPWRGSRKG
jgi:DNA replication protein DnaC